MYQPAADPDIRIIEPLGTGGTAAVDKAYHNRLQRMVALKHELPGAAEVSVAFSRLVEREYELIGGFRYPGLVRLLDKPAPNGEYLLLEVCPGPTLDRIGRIDDIGLAINIISALAIDLEFLRAAGLVHGDLKPQNVFLSPAWERMRPDQLFYVKLSDMSLGRRLVETHQARLGLGTIGFMAPETIADGTTGSRSDLFALGIIAYQLLTGVHPFMEGDCEPVKVNSRIRESEPTPPSSLRPDLPDGLARTVTRLLAKSETDRPASGWEVCLDLEEAGATYPFREALRPSFLIRSGCSYETTADGCLALDANQTRDLADMTEEDPRALRLILTANFLKNRLVYGDGRFQFIDHIYWPNRFRSRVLARFSAAPLADRKAAVRAAVVGGTEAAQRLGIPPINETVGINRPLLTLLPPLLGTACVRRLSARYAPEADRLGHHDLATRLHLQAGHLEEADRCADLAARELNRRGENGPAVALLRKVEMSARTSDREFNVRGSLLLKANILKESGELDQAQTTYDRLVALYQGRPPDKLLAETYKNLGELYRHRHDTPAALRALEESLAVFTELDDQLEISHTLTNMGNVHWLDNDLRRALAKYRTAYKIQKALDVKPDIASTLHNIATIFVLDGRIKRSIFLMNHALQLKKEVGHLGEIARTLNNLGYAYEQSGDPATAAGYLTESLDINKRIGSQKEVLYNLENLLSIQIAAGQLKKSFSLLKEGQGLAETLNLPAHSGQFHVYTATIAKRMGRYGDALRSLDSVDEILAGLDDVPLELLAEVQRAGVRYHLGDRTKARVMATDVYARASSASAQVPELESILLAVRLTGDSQYWEAGRRLIDERRLVREKRILYYGRIEYLLDNGKTDDAIELAATAGIELDTVTEDLELPWMESLTARLLLEQDDLDTAREHLERARRIAQASGLLPELVAVLALQGRLGKAEGDYEGSFAALKQALNGCRRMVASVDSEADRQTFQRKPVMQFLAGEIAALSSHIGKKQRAGV